MNQTKQWKKGYITILAGQTLSLVGSSAVQFGLIWWLASETSSPTMLALVGLMAFLPQILIGPFAGVWIDRMKKKNIMIAADLFIGVVALGFSVFFFTGTPPYWTVCLVAGSRAIGGAFHTPAAQAVVPLLVPQEELVKANAWSQFMQSGAFMLGPVLGAALYAALPMPYLLLTDLAGALIACAALAIVPIPEPERKRAAMPHFWPELKEGASVVLKYRDALWLLLAATAAMVFYLPLSSYFPLMTSDYFALSAWHGSLVEFLYAGGMMGMSAIIGGVALKRNKLAVAYLGVFGLGVTSLLCGILPGAAWAFWVYAALCLLMGACGPVFNIPYMAYMQESFPQESMGRAFALIGSLMSIAMPLGLLISGPVCERLGVSAWFLITGVATCAFVVLFRLMAARDKRKRAYGAQAGDGEE